MAVDFFAGCMGGCAGVLVGHPFDTVKVHLQTQNSKKPIYRGTFDCFKKIIAKDSVKGLYRGMSSPIAGVAFVNAIVFGVYGNIQRHTNEPNSLKSHFMAGSLAGLIQSLICSPMELAKTRIQLQVNCKKSIKHRGPLQCLNHIRTTEGFHGIYRGLGITAIRDVPGFASYFVSYELMMNKIQNPTPYHILMAGGLAGTISWILTFPIDVVKSSLQADGMSGKTKYNGILDCMRKGYQSEGYSFYCRGLASTLLRAFPMNASCFLVVSWTMKYSEQFNFNEFDINLSTLLGFIGSASSSLLQYTSHQISHNPRLQNYDRQCRKSHMIKSLVFLGAFSEAICQSEIIELANDLFSDRDDVDCEKNNLEIYYTRLGVDGNNQPECITQDTIGISENFIK